MSAVADTLDKDVFNTLTPEEQAAINDHEYTPAELAAMKAIAGEDGAAGEGSDDAGDDAGAADEVIDADGNPVQQAAAATDDKATPAAAAATDTPAGDADAAPVAAAPAQDAARPVYVSKLPEDFASRKEAVEAKEGGLWEKFDAGDIDRAALQAGLREVQSERESLGKLEIKAEISQELTAQSAEDAWRTTVTTFFSTVKTAGGPDYHTDEARRGDLDMFVKALAADERTADKPMDWFLAEAHKRVQALHGEAAPAPKPDAGKPKDPIAEARAKRTPNMETAPKTLAQVPGADGPGDVGSEFAHLDALEGDALESAIARMTPTQREKYARGE